LFRLYANHANITGAAIRSKYSTSNKVKVIYGFPLSRVQPETATRPARSYYQFLDVYAKNICEKSNWYEFHTSWILWRNKSRFYGVFRVDIK